MINRQFATYLSNLPRTAVTESVTALYNALFESLDGDAGNYFRKLIRSTDPSLLRRIHSEVIEEMSEECPEEPQENWIQWLWNWFRGDFELRNSDAVYFAPGIARIVMCQPDSDRIFKYTPHDDLSRNSSLLSKIVHYIAHAHKDSYTRFLADKSTGEVMTYERLVKTFKSAVKRQADADMAELATLEYTPNNYVIVELKDFETAHKFAKYTELRPGDARSGWCHTEYNDTFDYYSQDGRIRLYIAYKPGFEKLNPGDPGYGQSMLGIDVGSGNKMIHCNNRYNHDDDPELDNKQNPPGDNRFTAKELSILLGAPFYQLCPYYDADERRKRGITSIEDVEDMVDRGEDVLAAGVSVIHEWNGWKVLYADDKCNVLTPDHKSLVFDDWMDRIHLYPWNGGGILHVINNEKHNLFQLNGKQILDKWYDDIRVPVWVDGNIEIEDNYQYNWLDKNLHFVYKNWYTRLPKKIIDNLYFAFTRDGKLHLINNNEEDVVDPHTYDGLQVHNIEPYSDNYSIITVTDDTHYMYDDEVYNILDNHTGKILLDRWFYPYEFDDDHKSSCIVRVRRPPSTSRDAFKVYQDILDYQHPDHYLINDERVHTIFKYDDPNLFRVAFTMAPRTVQYNVLDAKQRKWIFNFMCDSIRRTDNGCYEIRKGDTYLMTRPDGTFIVYPGETPPNIDNM